MIDTYSFGTIVIDGTTYSKDIIIYPDGRILHSWWRKTGHGLCMDDIAELIKSGPQIIIAGTGSPGLMKPEPGLKEILEQKGIAFTAIPSTEAMKLYNNSCDKMLTGACFHLTC